MFAYHVVTERPMYAGQQIIFDDEHHNGVFQRVYEKIGMVNDILRIRQNMMQMRWNTTRLLH